MEIKAVILTTQKKILGIQMHVVTNSEVPPPLFFAQALPCLSTGTRLTVVLLTFSVLVQGGGGGGGTIHGAGR